MTRSSIETSSSTGPKLIAERPEQKIAQAADFQLPRPRFNVPIPDEDGNDGLAGECTGVPIPVRIS